MRLPNLLLSAALLFTLSGCAPKDPVATALAAQGKFGIVKPASAGLVLGDVHELPDLTRPSVSMMDVTTPAAIQTMMASRATEVTLADSTGARSYDINLSGSYPQVISAELQAKGASNYTLRFGRAVQYDSPTVSHLNAVLLPMIRERFPNDLSGKYIIRSLLAVDSMEYQFTNSSGGKIDLAPDPALIGSVKAKLGAAWTINNAGSLVLTQPRFIGFRLARIDKDNFGRAQAPGAPAEAQFVSGEVFSAEGRPPQGKKQELDAAAVTAPTTIKQPAFFGMKSSKRSKSGAASAPNVRTAYRAAVARYLNPRHPDSRSGIVSAVPTHNVIGVGIGKRKQGRKMVPAILFYVRNKLAGDHIYDHEMLPREIRGVPTDVIETGTPRMTSRPGQAVIVPLGGMDNLGTFGAVVRSNTGQRYILSNNHVLANMNENAPGTPIFAADGDHIASLDAFVPLSLTGSNLTDSALARILPGIAVETAVDGATWTSSQPGNPDDDALVFKTGARSGYTEGTIESPLASKRVDDEFGRSILMRDAFIIADGAHAFCIGGDSGAVVVDALSRKAIGLVVGRAVNSSGQVHTVACPLNSTLSLLKARLGAGSLTLLT